MGIQKKFNVLLLVILLPVFVVLYWSLNNKKEERAESSLQKEAAIIHQVAESIRSYNQDEVSPLISQNNEGFVPQTVGSYAAVQVMNNVNQALPAIHYRVVIDDSPLPRYQANVWQQNILDQFKNKLAPTFLSKTLADADGQFYVYATPIKESQQITGAKIVRINLPPKDNSFFDSYLLLLGLVFVVLVLVFNLLMSWWLFRPIEKLSIQSEKISLGQSEQFEIVGSEQLEISRIAQSFNRMQRSLKAAMGMLS